jgi:hypothetical protein
MFSNTKPGSSKKEGPNKKEQGGVRSGNVEVFPTSSGSGQYQQNGALKQAVEVEIVYSKPDCQFKDDNNYDTSYQPSSAKIFENAWKGGPASAASSTFSTTNGRSGEAHSSCTDTVDINGSMNDAMQRRARDLLATNQEICGIILRAQSNGKLRKAVHDCVGDSKSFGRYWDDPNRTNTTNTDWVEGLHVVVVFANYG